MPCIRPCFISNGLGGFGFWFVGSVVSAVGCACGFVVGNGRNGRHDDGNSAVDDGRFGGALQMPVVASVSGDGIGRLSVLDYVHAHDLRLTVDAQQAEAFQKAEHDAAKTHRPQSDDEEAHDVHAWRGDGEEKEQEENETKKWPGNCVLYVIENLKNT